MPLAGLARFNAADQTEARALLLACAPVPRWAEAVLAGRPYPDVPAVLAAAGAAAHRWTADEVAGALAHHPRIGQRAAGDGADAAYSRREQAGVDLAEDGLRRRLEAGNRAYEDRFGHVFLIRAAGRDTGEILAQLEERLSHDPATERRVTAEQLREIALLRLAGALS